MNLSRIIISQFCDDIRQEAGNKYSLMGCYGNELLVEKFPVLLPKLCVQVRVITPIDKPFSKLIIRAVMDSDIMAEMNIISGETTPQIPSGIDDSVRTELSVMMTFSPLPITEPSKLRIEAEADNEILCGGFLLFGESSPNNHST
ncbi:MAG: hypothetical protein COB30_009885 [Ectothiorhodospiraceae bacterium]|nr:hypothetical protein [Ectothiorhodospiraceae bacterium]